MMRDPLVDAYAMGLRIELAELGTWSPAVLVSEYDHAAATIRINLAAAQRLRQSGGEVEACALIRCAVAHELYHHFAAVNPRAARGDRRAVEGQAHAFARERYGLDPERFERII